MIEHLLRYALPAAYGLLPPALESQAATVLLLTIALHTTGLERRRPRDGPWRGFWAIQRGDVRMYNTTGGLAELVADPVRQTHVLRLLEALRLPTYPAAEMLRVAHQAQEYNDVLAAGLARLTLPQDVPAPGQFEAAYRVFEATWHPQSKWYKERFDPAQWEKHYTVAMQAVTAWNVVTP